MAIERRGGKARPTLPRSSDLTVAGPAPSRTAGRDGSGRFVSGNPWAAGAKWRSLIAEGLGRDFEGQAGALGRRAYRLFRAFLADLPCDCATVRSLVAQRARAVALADAYTAEGTRLGLHCVEGARALAEAAKWDARAERLAVTSLDMSSRLAGRDGRRKVIDLGHLLSEASKPRGEHG